MNMKVLGLNSGLGVSLFPFRKHLMGNIETRGIFHTPGNEQWNLNFPGVPLIKKMEGPPDVKDVDVLISSPDCGSSSIFRLSRAKEFGDQKKNDSLSLFFVGLRTIRPKFFYFENLPGLFKSFSKPRFIDLANEYYLMEFNESVTAWGNSQKDRVRLIIIGIRRDLPFKKIRKYFTLPEKVNLKTCSELYGDLSNETGNVREPINELISIYGGKKMSLLDIQKEWQVRLKGKKRFWVDPSENRKFKTAPGVYRNLKNSYPATARKANRQFDHQGLTLSPRQLARVQGVPDKFKIHIDPNKLKYWINKGRTVVTKTPPMEISYWFKSCLKKSYKLWK